MRLQRSFQEYCRKNKLLKKSDTIIIGVSGGKDSVSLLHLLMGLRRTLGLNLVVAHFNHRLRSGSQADEIFVKALADAYHVPFLPGRSQKKNTKSSIEQNARLERFAFFNAQAVRLKADAVALAHSRDDLAETLLMRLIRGGGTKGLAAIIPKRKINGTLYIRPLLFASREDILYHVRSHKLKYREDPSNKQKKFFRNLIRLEMMPLLEKKYNPNIKEILAQTADNAATDYDYLLKSAQTHFSKLRVSKPGGRILLKLQAFKKLHPAMQRMVLRLAIEELAGSTRRITFKHWQEMTALIFDRPDSALVNLPNNVGIAKDSTNINLYISKA